MNFSEWFKQQLEAAGLNPTQFAEAIKENQPTIQRILSGETKNPRLKIVKKIEDYFNNKYEQEAGLFISGVKIDSFEEQLLKVFKALRTGHREAIMMMANKLYEIDRPNDTKATGKKKPQNITH